MGFPKIRGPLFGSPDNKSPTILGSILGPLIFGISHIAINPQDQAPKGFLNSLGNL